MLVRARTVAHGSSQDRVEWKLQLPAYTTATATPDPSLFRDLQQSSQQFRTLNPLSEARDLTHNPRDTIRIHYH